MGWDLDNASTMFTSVFAEDCGIALFWQRLGEEWSSFCELKDRTDSQNTSSVISLGGANSHEWYYVGGNLMVF